MLVDTHALQLLAAHWKKKHENPFAFVDSTALRGVYFSELRLSSPLFFFLLVHAGLYLF